MADLFGIQLGGAAQARDRGRQLDIQERSLGIQEMQQKSDQIANQRKMLTDNIKQTSEIVATAIENADARGIPREEALKAVSPVVSSTLRSIKLAEQNGIFPTNTSTLFQNSIRNTVTAPTPEQVTAQEAEKQGAIADAKRETYKTLTPEQTQQLGFPEGTVVQQSESGELKIKYEPTQDGTIRDRRVKALTDRFVENGMELKDATRRAEDIVDGNIDIVISDDGRYARLVNNIENTVEEVKISSDVPERVGIEGPSLYDRADLATGVMSGAKEFGSGIGGQISDDLVAEETIQARQDLRTSVNELIRALSINPRFPVGEINRIREEVKLEPSVFDSPGSLRAKMESIDKSLRNRLNQAERDARDSSLPEETRTSQAANASAIRNFLDILGVPDEEVPEGVDPDLWKHMTPEERELFR